MSIYNLKKKCVNYENRPTNVEISKITERSNSHIFLTNFPIEHEVKTITTIIQPETNELIQFSIILTHFCKKKKPNTV